MAAPTRPPQNVAAEVPDFHSEVRPGRTIGQLRKLINEVLIDTPEKIIQIGDWLYEAYGDRLPKAAWKKQGIKISYTEASELKALSQDPVMRRNKKSFPPNRNAVIRLWRLLQHLRKIGREHLFQKRCDDEAINIEMHRGQIDDLRKLDGMTPEQRRADFRKAAIANPAYHDGSNIHTGDYTLLYDLLEDISVDMFFTDPPWDKQSVHLYGGLAKLAVKKLKPGGWCLAYCGHDSFLEVANLMAEHLESYWMFAVRYPHRKQPRRHKNIGSIWNPILAFRKRPFTRQPKLVVDLIDGDKDGKNFHEWGEGIKEAMYYIETLTKPNALVVDPFAGGGTVPAACKRLGRRCVAAEKNPDVASAIRKRLAETAPRPVVPEKAPATLCANSVI
jgi:hypothetical protein